MHYLVEKELREAVVDQINEANGLIRTAHGKKLLLESLKTIVKKIEAEIGKMGGENLS